MVGPFWLYRAATLRHRRPPRCRSPQSRLGSCAPGAAAFGDPSLTRRRGACQGGCGSERGAPRHTERHVGRAGETHAQRQETVAERNSERQERGEPGSRRHGSGGHGRGAPRTHTHARVHRPTPRYTQPHTRPAPPLRRFPPTKPSYNRPGWGEPERLRRLARSGGSWWCDLLLGSPWSPALLSSLPGAARSLGNHAGLRLASVTPKGPTSHCDQRSKSEVPGAGPGLAPPHPSPDLPWFLGGWTRSLEGYGRPRHLVRSPSRSFRSWLGCKGRDGAETRRQARPGAGGG